MVPSTNLEHASLARSVGLRTFRRANAISRLHHLIADATLHQLTGLCESAPYTQSEASKFSCDDEQVMSRR